MPDKTTVYMDHLIPRESLRYKRSEEQFQESSQPKSRELRLSDLLDMSMTSWVKLLHKPDFQRSTSAWTPKACVSLLDSIVKGQIVPSIIMWSNPDSGFIYILDGGHRISAVLAWMRDDWGQNLPSDVFSDDEAEEAAKQAAYEARNIVNIQIGNFAAYQAAEQELDRVVAERKYVPANVMGSVELSRAMFYRQLRNGSVHFEIQWVKGDYATAEQSFLKINKSGSQLTDWETTIVEKRDSSLVRTVMSIANTTSARHYWPIPSDKESLATFDKTDLDKKVKEIVIGVEKINELLFKPTYKLPVRTLQQPILVAPGADKKPYYLAELITVVKGGKGQDAETEKLINRDKDMLPGV